MAKRWHPDIAPPGKQVEHERHLQAINRAADQLERLAEESRGGRVSRNAVKVSAAAAREAREEAGRRAYEAEQRARGRRRRTAARTIRSATACPTTRSCTATPAVVSYPEWGVGTVTGIYFSGDGRRTSSSGRGSCSRSACAPCPAGSLQFVDFSKPDPPPTACERFMTAAQHAHGRGRRTRSPPSGWSTRATPTPGNPAVLRLMTVAFWQSGNLPAAAPRGPGLGARRGRPRRRRTASRRASTRTWARSRQAADSAAARWQSGPRADAVGVGAAGPPAPADGRPRRGALAALERARVARPDGRGTARPRARPQPRAATSAARCRPASRRRDSDPGSPTAWSRYAHALARTDAANRVPCGLRARARARRRPGGARPAGPGPRDRAPHAPGTDRGVTGS